MFIGYEEKLSLVSVIMFMLPHCYFEREKKKKKEAHSVTLLNTTTFEILKCAVQSAGAIEYVDCIFAER